MTFFGGDPLEVVVAESDSMSDSNRGAAPKVLGVIPARYASTRFPGKPLALILGKPMIVHTYESAIQAKSLDKLVVATDDERIRACCEQANIPVVLTDTDLPNGTARCAQALEKLGDMWDVVVNIQGDEPLIEPHIIDACVETLWGSPSSCVHSTPVTALSVVDVHNPSRVKCVLDKDGYALYFSRSCIPGCKASCSRHGNYYLHLGLQCYDANYLRIFTHLLPTPLEIAEDLEQLRTLENGYRIKVVVVAHEGHGVDEPADIISIEKIVQRQRGEIPSKPVFSHVPELQDHRRFAISAPLAKSTHFVGSLSLCELLLHNDYSWPWLILVPRKVDAEELHDLSTTQLIQLINEITACSKYMSGLHNVHKVNVGALGCICRQLHVHIVGRHESDKAWPGPVWGEESTSPYESFQLQETIAHISASSAFKGLWDNPSN